MPVPKRKKTSPAREAEVLVRSRRLCCVCVGLKADLSPKHLQILHLDHDPSNDAKNNLVALCLDHHDDYDTIPRLSKKLTKGEVLIYRRKLDLLIDQRDQQVTLQFKEVGGSQTNLSSNALVLGQVIEAQDTALTQLAEYHRPNGVRITRLGLYAATELGDFDTSIQALLALIRLETASIAKGGWATLWDGQVPTATPGTGALTLLAGMADLDWTLHELAVRRMRAHAVFEDDEFIRSSDYQRLPRPSFLPVVSMLAARASDQETPQAADAVIRHLAGLVVGVGVGLSSRGVGMPPPPTRILVDASGKRLLEDFHKPELSEIVSACHTIASLPKPLFDHAVHSIPKSTGMPNVVRAQKPTVDRVPTVTRSQAEDWLRSWALMPRWAIVGPLQVGTDKDVEELLKVREALEATYLQVATELAAFLEGENRLLSRP